MLNGNVEPPAAFYYQRTVFVAKRGGHRVVAVTTDADFAHRFDGLAPVVFVRLGALPRQIEHGQFSDALRELPGQHIDEADCPRRIGKRTGDPVASRLSVDPWCRLFATAVHPGS